MKFSRSLTPPSRVRVADQCSTSVWARASPPPSRTVAMSASRTAERARPRRAPHKRAGPAGRPAADAYL